MPLREADAQMTQRQLERLLESKIFRRSPQLSRLLRFLVEQHLQGRGGELKESVIGVEVFGRDPDYNPRLDPIVRTEARRLRERLSDYYADEGRSDPLVIEVPKGAYLPVICPAAVVETVNETGAGRRWLWPGIGMASIALLLGIAVWMRFHPRERLPERGNSEAQRLYVQGLEFEAMPGVRGVEQSIDLFQQAIVQDRSFAPAWAGVAAGEAARSAFDRFGPSERAGMIAAGWAASKQSLRLNPRLAEAWDGLAMMQAREGQWQRAQQSFQRAVELAPGNVLIRDHFALFCLLPLGRIEEAIQQLRSAEERDPLSAQTHGALNTALRAAGRYDEADFHCQKAAENDQARSSCWAQTLLRQGKGQQAVVILEAMWNGRLMDAGAQALAIGYVGVGRRADAERIAALVPRPASKAAIFAALGDKDRVFEALDQMAPMGPTRIGRDVLISPGFALLRGDPRLAALRKRVGLPG